MKKVISAFVKRVLLAVFLVACLLFPIQASEIRDTDLVAPLETDGGSEFVDGVPGASSGIYYYRGNSDPSIVTSGFEGGVPGVSSDSAHTIGLPLAESDSDKLTLPFHFSVSLEGYVHSDYRYKVVVSGLIVYEDTTKLFHNISWQAYDFPGQNHFYITGFKNAENNGASANIEAVGTLVTDNGLIVTVEQLLRLSLDAEDIW